MPTLGLEVSKSPKSDGEVSPLSYSNLTSPHNVSPRVEQISIPRHPTTAGKRLHSAVHSCRTIFLQLLVSDFCQWSTLSRKFLSHLPSNRTGGRFGGPLTAFELSLHVRPQVEPYPPRRLVLLRQRPNSSHYVRITFCQCISGPTDIFGPTCFNSRAGVPCPPLPTLCSTAAIW